MSFVTFKRTSKRQKTILLSLTCLTLRLQAAEYVTTTTTTTTVKMAMQSSR